jgi:putative transposase
MSLEARRLRLIAQILDAPAARLADIEIAAGLTPPSPAVPPTERDWPHAPLHRLANSGTYMVTTGTYLKEHHFRHEQRRDLLETALLARSKQAGWQLEAWAVFSNHYHFVGHASDGCEPLSVWLGDLHEDTSTQVNELDGVLGRKVWFNYWETELTIEPSYLARLNYVHQNAVKHGLVTEANLYPWCSASWFERTATRAQVRTIYRFKTDRLKIIDEFDPV